MIMKMVTVRAIYIISFRCTSKSNNINYLPKNGIYFTAVLELEDMFDGGGVPIDHYIIQVDNGTLLQTTGPTYSFDIMYNTTLSVNISAHNCAGYSDLFPLEIDYVQGLFSFQ